LPRNIDDKANSVQPALKAGKAVTARAGSDNRSTMRVYIYAKPCARPQIPHHVFDRIWMRDGDAA